MYTKMTSVYLVCFHSAWREIADAAKDQYRKVEMAIHKAEWPSDNGDDPSFYVARQGGRLTWGVCRQDLRNAIKKDSIVAFFSFTCLEDGRVLYRLCAVATVAEKVSHCDLYRDPRFSQCRDLYINRLITPEKDGWRYDETNRPRPNRHDDWLWRISDHKGIVHEKFDKKYASVYREGWFSDADVARGRVRLGGNCIVFSDSPDYGFISPTPPEVATSKQGKHENWTDRNLQKLTVDTAARFNGRRRYLRVENKSGQNVHRWIRFDMPIDEAVQWRNDLISALKGALDCRVAHPGNPPRAARTIKC